MQIRYAKSYQRTKSTSTTFSITRLKNLLTSLIAQDSLDPHISEGMALSESQMTKE